jgi:hypothetical protein
LKGTLRQRMEQHRANPSCATCHARMDPLGFGFENFDAVGAWRTHEGKNPIDPSGVLPGGQEFKGPAGLRAILVGKKGLFARCLAEKMLTYALGRGVERADRCFVEEIARNLAKEEYRFSALVLEVIRSDPFQKRRGGGQNDETSPATVAAHRAPGRRGGGRLAAARGDAARERPRGAGEGEAALADGLSLRAQRQAHGGLDSEGGGR